MTKILEKIRLSTEFETFHTIQDAVYESLRKAILNRELPMGERLIEKHLAEAFCVSRTPVRQALKKLGDEGLVDFAGRQGVTVSHMTQADVNEVFKLREAFEGLILESVSQNMNRERYNALTELIISSQMHYSKGELGALKASFEALHSLLVETARMPRTAMMLEQIVDYLNQFRTISIAHPSRCQMAIDEHERIVHALWNQKVREAVEQNSLHLKGAKEIMLCTVNDQH